MDAETSRESPSSRLRQVDGHLIFAPEGGTEAEVDALYRDVAVFCIEAQVMRILIKPCGDDGEERALRGVSADPAPARG